jgi:protein tyrosine/serine phosphatase
VRSKRAAVRVRFTAAVAALLLASAGAAYANVAIDNFGRINDRYYRGAQPEGRDYADLAALGVKTVIDLTADGDPNEAGLAARVGLKFFRIPLTTHAQPSAQAVSRFLALVNDPANQPVYVHCQGGRHRTGVMTAVYRMSHDGWTADRAFAEMQQYKFGPVFLHSALRDFVYDYYTRLDHKTADASAGSSAGSR